ncbi:hypothetical protein [Alkalimonas amylolytica]|uniref:Uncharacterized protein n=1 Tax=Alkalimonas amylolytica TaxID=152573 RepID=A0A1H3XR43_ALKAM|nr:hypothetical protein [Alkalimonas amylolytica]SEA01869.1 hypothetical protein SAMN04488051_101356 [Alkalimonas amylolytica]
MDASKIKQYLYGNISTVFWFSFLSLGGAVYSLYYSNIGYMPDLDFQSAVTFLAVASITATLLVILFMVSLIIPGVFWVETWSNDSKFKRYWEKEDGSKNFLRVVGWFVIPLLFWLGVVVVIISEKPIYLPVFLIVLILVGWILNKKSQLTGKELATEYGRLVFTSIGCTFLAFFPIYIVSILTFSGVETTKGSSIFVGFLVAFAIGFINLLAIMKRKSQNGLIYYSVLGLTAFFILFSSFEMFHRIPERVMEIYKFGAIKNASVVFKSEACLPLKMQGVIQSFEAEAPCKVSELTILSRLGEEFYIEKDKIRIAINKSDVISWAVSKPDA